MPHHIYSSSVSQLHVLSASCAIGALALPQPMFRAENLGMDAIGPIAQRLRIARGLTQREIGAAVGVTSNSIARVESGRGSWHKRTAAAILAELHRVYPLTPEEVTEFATAADLPEAMYAHAIATASRSTPLAERSDTELIIDMLQELVSEHGADAMRDAIESLVVEHRRNRGRRAKPIPPSEATVSDPQPVNEVPPTANVPHLRHVSDPRVVDLGQGVKAIEQIHTQITPRASERSHSHRPASQSGA